MCSRGNPISIFMSGSHRGTGSREKTKFEDVCGLFTSMRVSLEGGREQVAEDQAVCELRQWETGGQAHRHRRSVSASGSATAGGKVHHKSRNTCVRRQCHLEAVRSASACAERVCLLSKWLCLCLKVDCRLVLSLETGALISVWLCWLSFSSISTVQQEKPCGHTLSGAPARHETLMLFSTDKQMTRIKNTFLQNPPGKKKLNTFWGTTHYLFNHSKVDSMKRHTGVF